MSASGRKLLINSVRLQKKVTEEQGSFGGDFSSLRFPRNDNKHNTVISNDTGMHCVLAREKSPKNQWTMSTGKAEQQGSFSGDFSSLRSSKGQSWCREVVSGKAFGGSAVPLFRFPVPELLHPPDPKQKHYHIKERSPNIIVCKLPMFRKIN